MTMRITKQTVRRRVREVIADAKGVEIRDIRGIYKLGGRWSSTPRGLGFTDSGRLALLVKLNAKFSDVNTRLTPTQIRGADRVRDVWNTVWNEMPERHRREG